MLSVWKTALAVSLVSVLWIGASRLFAAEQGGMAKTEHVVHQAYLGVGIEAVDPSLVQHLPETFHQGQGVLVVAVAADSPAEKAGIKPHDILMSYGDQKLFAPRQLLGLVRSDKAGHEVTLTILRSDKPEQIKVTLGSHDLTCAGPPIGNMPRGMMQGNMPMGMGRMLRGRMAQRMSPEAKSSEKETSKETFDSMTIQNLGKDKFKAHIRYLDENGKLEKHEFEGNLKELHHAILAEKDLPSAEREQLLRSLDLPYEGFDLPNVSWRIIPPIDWGYDRADGVF